MSSKITENAKKKKEVYWLNSNKNKINETILNYNPDSKKLCPL